MSDDNESLLVTAIQESAFGELNHLINLYNRYESLADCLTLMEPDNLRQIIIDAANQLTHICMSCLEEIYEDFQQENPRANVSKIKPSISRINDYHNTILGNTQMIEREINQYESFFDGFIHSLGQDNDSNNVYGAGAIGSVIGGTLFGPVGGFIRVLMKSTGEVLLVPMATIPEKELWIFKSPTARDSLERGLAQAQSGEVSPLNLESLTTFANTIPDDIEE